MTRINCIPVEELTDAHLGAEYRELPRVFALAAAAYARGDDPSTYPNAYTLGKGHVKFFYTRLNYIAKRYQQLVNECLRRGRKVNYHYIPGIYSTLPPEWRQDWTPTPQAQVINRQRIADRLEGK